MGKNTIDVISCECLDAEYWRIKYRSYGIVSDDVFKRVTRLETTINESQAITESK